MIRKIQRQWFEVWGDAEAQNNILKYLLLLFTFISTAELILICTLAFKKPLIISVNHGSTEIIEQVDPDTAKILREVGRAIKKYLRNRHNWDWNNIEEKIKTGAQYVAPEFREKFLIHSQEQIRIAKEKQVTQKIFVDEPVVDQKEKRATVKAERILIVGGLHAAQEMNFQIDYSLGSRTDANPEGVYITNDELKPQNP